MTAQESLLAAARASAASNAGRPATQAVMTAIAKELEGSPAWLPVVIRAWEGRFFLRADEALALLWTAMHYCALNGHRLGRYLPTCGGALSPAIGDEVRAFLASPPEGFTMALYRRRKTYTPYFSSQWIEPAKLFFQRRSMPFYLVELDSPAGLGACADLINRTKGFDSALVEARIGLAAQPLDPRKDEDAKWLIAAWMPDDIVRVSATATALKQARAALAKDATAVQMAACPTELAGAFIAKNIPVADDQGLLVFGCEAVRELDQAKAQAMVAGLAQALAPWADRALWVDASALPADPWASRVKVTRNGPKGLLTRVYQVAASGSRSSKVRADATANAAFLA